MRRKRQRRRRRLVVTARAAMATLLVFVVSSCGGSDPSARPDATESTSSAPSLYSILADGEISWKAAAGDVHAIVIGEDRMPIVTSRIQASTFSVRAFDLASGAERWKVALKEGDFPAQVIMADESVVLMTESSSGQTIEAIDPSTSAPLWQRPLSGLSSAGVAEADGLILVADAAADKVMALEPATGHERWAQVVAGVSGDIPVIAGQLVVVNSLTELHALDVSSGNFAWATPTIGDVEQVVAFGDAVGVITSGDAGQPSMSLEVFGANSGAARWSFTNPSISVPPQDAAADRVVALTAPDPSTGDTVVTLDLASGSPLWSAAPPGGALGPTVVLPSGDVLVAASHESGPSLSDTTATLLRAATGGVVWHADIPGTVLVPPTASGTSVLLAAESDDGATGRALSLDLASGALLWTVNTGLPALSSPTINGDAILIGGAYRRDLGR